MLKVNYRYNKLPIKVTYTPGAYTGSPIEFISAEITNITETSATFNFQTSKAGTVYYGLLEPTTQIAATGEAQSVELTGLTQLTEYTLYYKAVDAYGNDTGLLTLDFQTITTLFDVFVSAISGDDSNEGTFESQKKTITNAMLTGDRVGINPDEIVNEYVAKINFTKNGFSFKSYGDEPAIIDPNFTIIEWGKTDGYTNVYEGTVNIAQGTSSPIKGALKCNMTTLVEQPFSSYTHILKVASLALCDSTANSCYTASETGTLTKIYVNIGENPVTSIYQIKVPAISKTFDAEDIYTAIYSDMVIWSAIQASPAAMGIATINNVFFANCHWWHHFISNGGNIKNAICVNSSPIEAIAYVNYQAFLTENDLEYQHGLFIDVRFGMYAHTPGGGVLIGHQNIHNNFLWGVSAASSVALQHNDCVGKTNTYSNIFATGFTNGFYGNGQVVITDSFFKNINDFLYLYGGVAGVRSTIDNCIINYNRFYINTAAAGYEADFENCIMHLNTAITTTVQTHSANTTLKFSSQYNIIIIDAPNNPAGIMIYANAGYSTNEACASTDRPSDYNVFILASGTAANVRWGRSSWTLATWRTNTGKDLNSIFIDLTTKGGFSYLFNDDYTMKDVPERAQVLAVGAGLTKTFRGEPVKPTYEEAYAMQRNGTLDNYTRDLFE